MALKCPVASDKSKIFAQCDNCTSLSKVENKLFANLLPIAQVMVSASKKGKVLHFQGCQKASFRYRIDIFLFFLQ
jgi:hypothetical protein